MLLSRAILSRCKPSILLSLQHGHIDSVQLDDLVCCHNQLPNNMLQIVFLSQDRFSGNCCFRLKPRYLNCCKREPLPLAMSGREDHPTLCMLSVIPPTKCTIADKAADGAMTLTIIHRSLTISSRIVKNH